MSENIQESKGENRVLNVETGATRVHEDEPAVHNTTELEEVTQSQTDGEAVKVTDGDGGKVEKVERQEKGHEAADGSLKDAETGDKRQRPTDLNVEVSKDEEGGETGAKKAKVTKNRPGKGGQSKPQAKAALEKPKRGPGRPRKKSAKVDNVHDEGEQKLDAKETGKAIN